MSIPMPQPTATHPNRHKKAYIINCTTKFRNDIVKLAESKHVNVGDLARSIILTIPEDVINAFPDPGDPSEKDREPVFLKSGDNSGKVWRRKPRLQARLPEGCHPITLRKALGLALSLSTNKKNLTLHDGAQDTLQKTIDQLANDQERLHKIIDKIAFIPFKAGCSTIEQALYILGLPRHPYPNHETIKKRYRELATIFHPDSICGSHDRMSQLNIAFDLLKGNR